MTRRTANCPNCGAEITFRWSGAVQTSCPACRSVLVRHDVDFTRVGTIGDVPPSMSRIQLGTEGRYNGKPFVVVGRIVYRYGRGHWSEWHIRLGESSSAWLSDAQGEYVITREAQAPPQLDRLKQVRAGERVRIGETEYAVATVTNASYAGVEGELPFEYWDKGEVPFIDLRNESRGFATVDYSESPPLLFVGEAVEFRDLALKHLTDAAASGALGAGAAKGLNCTQCGAAIELRTGNLAQTVACVACGAIMDATDPNFRVLVRHQELTQRVTPAIPLGSVGKIGGESWQVIGFQVRGIRVEDVPYDWREYLLWNADAGFRYLTEYDGHWNDIIVAKDVPKQVTGGRQPVVQYNGTRFKHFQSAVAKTHLVLGEFPWEARAGDVAKADDFVAPPLMLSRESTGNEVTWSVGSYTAPKTIQAAFSLREPLRQPRGVFANQPNPVDERNRGYGRAFLALVGLLFLVFLGRQVTARNESVFTGRYVYDPARGDSGAFVTRAFDLAGHPSNVEIAFETNLSNDWAFFNLALLADSGGTGYDFGREVSYYSGVDGGESWSEGSRTARVILPEVPAGRYYLRVEPEKDAPAKPMVYSVSVRRDVPRWLPFGLVLLLLAVPPAGAWLRARAFEQARWKESDHAPASSDDDD